MIYEIIINDVWIFSKQMPLKCQYIFKLMPRCGKNVVKVWQKCGKRLAIFYQKLYTCEQWERWEILIELEFFKLKKLILLTLSIMTLLSTVATGFAYENSEPTEAPTAHDYLDIDDLEVDETYDDDIPDGWYDPEYGPLIHDQAEVPSAETAEIAPATLAIQTNEQQVTTVRRSGVIARNNTAMREGYDRNSRTIRHLSGNTNVRITGRLGNRYRIRFDSTDGWVSRDNMVQTRQTAIVRDNNVAVRASRSNNAQRLTTVNRGQRLTVTHRTGTWSQVTVNERTGWIRNNQLTTTNGRRPGNARNQTALHSRPDANSTVRLNLVQNQEFMILQRTANGNRRHQGWTQVQIRHSGGTETGWIRTSQVRRENQSRRITGGSAPFRTGPGSSFAQHSRVASIGNNTQVRVLAESGNWSRVQVRINGRNEEGWIANANLTRISIGNGNGNADIFDSLLEYGQQYLGRAWRAGGNTPTTGFDCSGFTQWIYGVHGITLGRSSQDQFNAARSVTRNNAQPGDLVFFERTYNSSNRITHVGMYVGNGRMLHVSTSRGVEFVSATSGWWGNHLVGFGRVID